MSYKYVIKIEIETEKVEMKGIGLVYESVLEYLFDIMDEFSLARERQREGNPELLQLTGGQLQKHLPKISKGGERAKSVSRTSA